MRHGAPAATLAAEKIARVRDSIAGRYRLAADFYRAAPGRIERYGRAELSFLRRTITRGVLNAPSAGRPGSRWWRAVNERLLRDRRGAVDTGRHDRAARTPRHLRDTPEAGPPRSATDLRTRTAQAG
ncbi:MAG: hypothetical protein ACRDOO_16755 [Actinomadura sp.]